MKILIAEDHSILASQLQKMLEKQKFSVDVVPDGETANNYLDSISYDLLLLDIGLPKIDGITLCETLRSQGKAIPILMLTGHNKIQDKLRGLNAGADDYLTKPFDSDELIARVHSLLRRRQLEVQPILYWGNLSLNQNLNQIYYENIPLNLTATEYRILALLLLNPHQVFSRQILIDRIWASTREIPSDETVKSHIKTIRRKLQSLKIGNLVKTVYGLGYCLDTESRDALVQLSSSPPIVEESHPIEKVVLKLDKKVQIFIFSTSCFVLDAIKLFSENNDYVVIVINTFEDIWDTYNVVIPTVFVMDAEFVDSTGIHLCRLLRSNSYFNHVPIAMIGNGSPYILDEIMEAGIDYFIDRGKIVGQLQSFSAWLNRKSYQYRG